jgi:RNA polymerase sigma factor (sigma-70 family)
MPEKTDEAYMLDVQNGDLSAMAALFERYQVRMYNYFLKTLAEPTAAEDLTQQLFIRVLHYRMKFRPGSVKSWLYRMATNLANDHYKLQSRNRAHQHELTEIHESYADTDYSYSESDYKELDRALTELNEEQRELIVLNKYHGMRYEEIAAILNLSVSNVRIKIHRAMIQLRKTYFNTVV